MLTAGIVPPPKIKASAVLALLGLTWGVVRSQTPAQPPQAGQSQIDYQFMTVPDFAIDGPKLAAKRAKVKITGSYILQGGIAVLYADTQAVVMARYHPEAGTQPSVALLTDDASRQLRQTLVSCDSDPSTGQIGCQITIRGRVTMCALSNAFGATRKTPCVNVDDGGLYQAPPPTAEQQRLTQEENERQRQAQLAQEKAQLQQWETEVVGCLAHATVNIYSVTDEPRLCMNRPDEPLNLPQPDDWPQPMKDALARCLGQYQRVVRHEAFPGAFMRMCTSVN